MLCFKCERNFSTVKAYLYHLKHDHNIYKSNDFYQCIESNCFRTFSLLNSFRKHLKNVHESIKKCEPEKTNDFAPITNKDNAEDFGIACSSKSNNFFDGIPSPDIKEGNMDVRMKAHKNHVLDFVSKLYNNSLIPRNVVQNVIESVMNIFCCGFVLEIKNCLIERLCYLKESQENIKAFEKMFETFQSSLDEFSTEYKRIKYFKDAGKYIPPRKFVIGQRLERKFVNNSVVISPAIIAGQIIPLRKVLQSLFQRPDFFNLMKTHYKQLMEDTTTYSNFIQGELWKAQIKNSKSDLIFPLFLYFDDYETGNPLGSHSGKNKLGAVYVSLASLPSELKASLSNIYLFALFHSQHRKTFGNESTFREIISELKYLEETGVKITVDTSNFTIFFKLALIIGDNLGLHTILGMTESFSSTFRCRFCKINKNDSSKTYTADISLLRTPQNYEDDLNLNDMQLTGVKEPCVWHRLADFHVTSNFSVDIMHDLLEEVMQL